MSVIRLQGEGKRWVHPLSSFCCRRLSSSLTSLNEPQYPPILEQGPLADKLRRKEKWHALLKSHDTVEEKLFELNMPKYYGWKSVILGDKAVPYNCLPWVQFATRTHLEVSDKITPMYSDSNLDSKASELTSQIKSEVEDLIMFEFNHVRPSFEVSLRNTKQLSKEQVSELHTKRLINHLNQILLASLVDTAPHLNLMTSVPDPRVDAFWFLGGINPSQEKIQERTGRTKMTNINVVKSYLDPSLVDLPVNEPIQFYGQPILQLQTKYPLPPAEALEEEDNRAQGIPHVPYEPSVMYLEKQYRRATTVPGFWPGEPQEFGMLSFHSTGSLNSRPFDVPHDYRNALHSIALLSSFSWLLGQACYQGFSTFHDVTYPLLTQTALTNGKEWSFYLYQLNTTLLHTKNSIENPRCNLCWGTEPQSLFQDVNNGRVIGFNDDVLKQIIKLYLLEPKERKRTEMKPYLSAKPYVADIDYEERRIWLESQFKFITSNRPRKQEKPEVYAWEYIYRIKHNDMRSKRTQWFVTQQPPPDCRRFNDHPRLRKPLALRTEEDMKLTPQIRRWKRTFYPGTNKLPIVPPGK